MDVAKYAVGPDSYDILSRVQISNFFSSNACTKHQCDDLATKLLGGPVSATPIQGGNSYTVERKGATKVVQFRTSQLDMAKFGLVQQVYLQFVPHCVYHGALESLHVYIWDRVPGPAFCRVRSQIFTSDIYMEQRLSQTVQDFAKFFALAWVNRPPNLEPPPLGLQDKYVGILNELELSLPDSLHSTIDMVRQNLYLLFRPEFPIALQHGDILENNIHIEEETGHITGVVDWHDAFVAPFGLSLGGVEILFGIQTHKDWHFHPSHVKLRQKFWDVFHSEIGQISEMNKRSIEIARLMGLLQTHGFEQNGMSGVYLKKLISV
ncbi:Protein kinase-like domain protein [Metarhizium rileyi]|uniref:Protein kinase-like domain protein n=1 Tax=Metarhizium rileyi (strain RCEF 4871) TaxID=1649241 RepID=A0A166YKD9_METRR|nr:Protein kinase-like domain protein [Metarhizium rileyi RCEF 4871]